MIWLNVHKKQTQNIFYDNRVEQQLAMIIAEKCPEPKIKCLIFPGFEPKKYV